MLFDSGSEHLRVQRRAYFIVDCVHCLLVSVCTMSLKCRNFFLHSCCSVLKRSKYSSLSSNHTKRHDDEGASSSAITQNVMMMKARRRRSRRREFISTAKRNFTRWTEIVLRNSSHLFKRSMQVCCFRYTRQRIVLKCGAAVPTFDVLKSESLLSF